MKIYNRDYDYIDFEAIKESWNLYDLEDGTIIKFKIVLLKIIPTVGDNDHGKGYAFNTANLVTVLATKELRGVPSASASPGAALKIEKKDIQFKVLTEEWNEYKLEDGKELKLKPTIVQIDRAAHYDQYGEPSYFVRSQPLIKL
jgi:hypothetical protein